MSIGPRYQRWAAAYGEAEASGRVRDADFTTLSGVEVDPVYGPPDEHDPRMERIGWPGEFPFTRGLHPSGYRGRAWTIRQFAGFGTAEQTNERYRMILAAGGGGLSVAFDMPTLMGRDSDDPRSLGEVGHCGVAIDSAADLEVLFAGIDLGSVTTSMTISGPAVPIFCMYVVAAERAGVDPALLNGTLQTDIFKEYIAQKEWLFAPGPHLRLIGDLMEYTTANIPAYKPLSVSGYHIREAGSTAAQELAFTLADGFGYVELGLSRGLDIEQFAPGLSFFFDAHIDFFEEIAKFRAARRIWARWLRDRYGARTAKAQSLRFHTQTAGVSLTAQQPYNNVVRTAVEALAAVLGGTNSLHTNALDETLALPTEESAEIALRTQQVLAEETGVINVADPLGGSWYVEALTDKIEAEAEAIFARIIEMGGGESARPRDRGDDLRSVAGDRGGLVHRADRRCRLHLPDPVGEGRQAGGGGQLPHRDGHRRAGDPAGRARGRGRPVLRPRCAAGEPRSGAGRPHPGRSRRRQPDRGESHRAHAGRRAGRGDPRRDLQRPPGRVGRLRRAGLVLSACSEPPGSELPGSDRRTRSSTTRITRLARCRVRAIRSALR